MLTQWTATFYIANRFGSMQEKQRSFPGTLSRQEVSLKMDSHLNLLRIAGQACYPGFDLEQRAQA